MKKVKVMLLSLALLAVVGGALAFKAKYLETFCYTYAFHLGGGAYTCTSNVGNVVTDCYQTPIINLTVDETPGAVTSYCTTTPIEISEDVFTCQQQGQPVKKCPIQTSTVRDR